MVFEDDNCSYHRRHYAHLYDLKSRMVSSGMLRRVALVRTDVSEEPSASFIKVTRIGELGTTVAATSNRRTLRYAFFSSSFTGVVTLCGRRIRRRFVTVNCSEVKSPAPCPTPSLEDYILHRVRPLPCDLSGPVL
jgi:hypothetical protein